MRKYSGCYPGAGVGGHCLPVDLYYPVRKAEELGYHSKAITAGRVVNDCMLLHMPDPSWWGEFESVDVNGSCIDRVRMRYRGCRMMAGSRIDE